MARTSFLALFVIDAAISGTVGEMIVMPTSQALAAGFARMDMRGDNYHPNLLWQLSALLCAISAAGFYALRLTLGLQPRFAVATPHAERRALAMKAEHG